MTDKAATPPTPVTDAAIEQEGKSLMLVIRAALAAAERQEMRRGVSEELYMKGLFFALTYITAAHGVHAGQLTPDQVGDNARAVARYILQHTPHAPRKKK